MAKKNCRMTDEERAMHDRAVRIRKMTDQQICEFVDRQHSAGIDEGIRLAQESTEKTRDDAALINTFIDYLENKTGSGNGIGGGTIYRLRKEVANAVADGIIGGTA